MVWILAYSQVCFGVVLGISSHYLLGAVTLPLPSPETLADGIKTEIVAYIQILSHHLIPAVSISLVIRKLTS
jgi:hypothetical protein